MALISLAVAPGVVSILRRPILTPHKAAATLAPIWPEPYQMFNINGAVRLIHARSNRAAIHRRPV